MLSLGLEGEFRCIQCLILQLSPHGKRGQTTAILLLTTLLTSLSHQENAKHLIRWCRVTMTRASVSSTIPRSWLELHLDPVFRPWGNQLEHSLNCSLSLSLPHMMVKKLETKMRPSSAISPERKGHPKSDVDPQIIATDMRPTPPLLSSNLGSSPHSLQPQ